jgi:hypothetical protein
MQLSAPLSPLQLELLKSFSMQTVSEQDLKEIRIMLSKYFAQKAAKEAQKMIESKGWDAQKVSALAEEHHRIPYNK